ncbi:hypothetical protein [Streptomyces noursei]
MNAKLLAMAAAAIALAATPSIANADPTPPPTSQTPAPAPSDTTTPPPASQTPTPSNNDDDEDTDFGLFAWVNNGTHWGYRFAPARNECYALHPTATPDATVTNLTNSRAVLYTDDACHDGPAATLAPWQSSDGIGHPAGSVMFTSPHSHPDVPGPLPTGPETSPSTAPTQS